MTPCVTVSHPPEDWQCPPGGGRGAGNHTLEEPLGDCWTTVSGCLSNCQPPARGLAMPPPREGEGLATTRWRNRWETVGRLSVAA